MFGSHCKSSLGSSGQCPSYVFPTVFLILSLFATKPCSWARVVRQTKKFCVEIFSFLFFFTYSYLQFQHSLFSNYAILIILLNLIFTFVLLGIKKIIYFSFDLERKILEMVAVLQSLSLTTKEYCRIQFSKMLLRIFFHLYSQQRLTSNLTF